MTDELSIPTIGIGAGSGTDGQVLVVNDVIGLSERQPPFAEAFGDVRGEMEEAIGTFADRVSEGTFPAGEDSSEADVDEDAAL